MDKIKTFVIKNKTKIFGLAVSAAGMVLTLMQDRDNKDEMERLVKEEVEKALKSQNQN